MPTMKDLISADEVLAVRLEDPKFRAAWARTTLARAVALAVVGYRVEHHLTQTQLARMLGMRQPHLARLETGEHTPSIETLQHLARVLGLRFIIDVAPAERVAQAGQLAVPPGIEVVEDVTAGDLRVLVATG